MSKTICLEMGDNFAALLAKEAEAKGLSEAEYIRRAVATYAWLRLRSHDGFITVKGKDPKEYGLEV